jgi:hypothetical protein
LSTRDSLTVGAGQISSAASTRRSSPRKATKPVSLQPAVQRRKTMAKVHYQSMKPGQVKQLLREAHLPTTGTIKQMSRRHSAVVQLYNSVRCLVVCMRKHVVGASMLVDCTPVGLDASRCVV